MKLSFPKGEHDELTLGKGSVTIGSDSTDNIVLTANGVVPGHAVITADRRGLTLLVEGHYQGAEPDSVRVNQRPIIEKAILRLGDTIEIGSVSMLLRADDELMQEPPEASGNQDDVETKLRYRPARVGLRGVAGDFFGQVFPIERRLLIGSSNDCDVMLTQSGISGEHAVIDNSFDGVYLRDLGSEQGACVNGNNTHNAVLHPGDQLAFGGERFVLEAPGYVPGQVIMPRPALRPRPTTQVFTAPAVDEPVAEADEPAQPGAVPANGKRDAMIIGICLVLSAAMLVWLFLNL